MSKKSIDEKVVSLQFDNRNFETNVATTLHTLDKLKSSLELNSAAQNVDEVGNAAERTGNKFSAMEVVFVTTVSRIATAITDKLIAPFHKLTSEINSLTFGEISEGFEKYTDKTKSVQTIMAATSDAFQDEGEHMQFVNEQLNKLIWFTDETSYNMVDMIENISKFTSNKVPLEDAVLAMEGIALEAGMSGANAQQAARAMYNFSQAMGVGAVKVQDWMSIENATMATAQFKEMLMDTAYELKTIKKVSDGVYLSQGKKGSHELTVQSFRSTLADEWLTSDVLVQTLKKYSNFTQELNETYSLFNKTGDYTTTEILKMLRDWMDESTSAERKAYILNDVMRTTGYTAEFATEYLNKLTRAENKLGIEAFIASQQSKTLEDSINATKDAASSKWLSIFEYIIGDYQQAVQVFSAITEELYDIFVQPVEDLRILIKNWNGAAFWGDEEIEGENRFLHGRVVLMEALVNIYWNLKYVMGAVKEGFREVFPAMTAKRLFDLTVAFRDFTEHLILSKKDLDALRKDIFEGSENIEKIKIIVQGIFSALDMVLMIIKPIVSILLQLTFAILRPLISILVDVLVVISRIIITFHDFLRDTEVISNSFEILVTLFKIGVNYIYNFLDGLLDITGKINWFKKAIDGTLTSFENFMSDLANGNTATDSVANALTYLNGVMKESSKSAREMGESFWQNLQQFEYFDRIKLIVGGAFKVISDLAVTIKNAVVKAFGSTADQIKEAYISGDIAKAANIIIDTIFGLFSIKFIRKLNELSNGAADVLESFSSAFGQVKNVLTSMQYEIDSKILANIAKSVLMLSLSVVMLTNIAKTPEGLAALRKAEEVIGLLTTLMVGTVFILMSAIKRLDAKSVSKQSIIALAVVIMAISSIARACVVFALAVRILGTMDVNTMTAASTIMLAFLGVITLFFAAVNHLAKTGLYDGKYIDYTFMLVAITRMIKVVTNEFFKLSMAFRIVGNPWNFVAGIISFTLYLVAIGGFLKYIEKTFGKKTPLEIKAMEKLMLAIGASMSSICNAFIKMSVAVLILGSMDIDALIQGGIAVTLMGAIFLTILTVFAKISKTDKDTKNIAVMITELGAAFAALSIGLLMISASVVVLGKLKLSQVIQGIAAITALLAIVFVTVMALQDVNVGKLAQLAGSLVLFSLSILAVSAAIFLFTTALIALGTIGSAGLIASIEALRILASGMVDILIEEFPRLLKAFIQMLVDSKEAVYAGILEFLEVLKEYIPPIIDKIIDIIILVLDGLTRRLPELSDHVADFLSELFQAGLKIFNREGAIEGLYMSIGLVGAVGILARVLASVQPIGPRAVLGALWCLAIIGEILLVFSLVGEFLDYLFGNKKEDYIAALDLAARAVEKVGEIIGGFLGGLVGSFVGGFVEGGINPIMEALPEWGNKLSEFWTNIKTFIDGIKTINSSDIESAESFAKLLLIIAGAELVDSISNFIDAFADVFVGEVYGTNNDNPMNNFANNVKEIGNAMLAFSQTLSSGDLDTEKIDKATECAVKLSELANAIPRTGGQYQNYMGVQDIAEFGNKIKAFINEMIGANKLLSTVVTWHKTAFQWVYEISVPYTDLAKRIPKTGGYAQKIAGEQDLAKFGSSVCRFINEMINANKLFSTQIIWHPEDFETARTIAIPFVELAKKIPRQDGWVQNIIGDQDLAKFGASLSQFVMFVIAVNEMLAGKKGFTLFENTNHPITITAGSLSSISSGVSRMENVKKIGMMMVDLAKELNSSTGGLTMLSTFIDDMNGFVTSLLYYNDNIVNSNIYSTIVEHTEEIVNAFVNVLTSLDGLNDNPLKTIVKAVETLTDAADEKKHDGDIKKLGEKMENFSKTIPGFVSNMKSFKDEDLAKADEEFSKFIDIALKGNTINSENWEKFASSLTILNETSFDGFINLFSTELESTNNTMDLFFKDLSKHVPTAGKPYKDAFLNLAGDGLKAFTNQNTIDLYKRAAAGLMYNVRQTIYDSGTLLNNVVNSLLKSAANYPSNDKDGALSSFRTLGNDIMNGLIGGMNEKLTELNDAINAICNAIPGTFKENLKINSPSKIMIEIGEAIPEGLANGIDDGIAYVSESLNSASAYIIQNTAKLSDSVRYALDSDQTFEPTISPVFDFSGFNTRKIDLMSNIDLDIRRPMDGLSNRILDAQSRIEASNNRVVDSINMLRQDVKDLGDKDRETNLYVDSTKLASSIAKPMDRQLNILAGRRR